MVVLDEGPGNQPGPGVSRVRSLGLAGSPSVTQSRRAGPQPGRRRTARPPGPVGPSDHRGGVTAVTPPSRRQPAAQLARAAGVRLDCSESDSATPGEGPPGAAAGTGAHGVHPIVTQSDRARRVTPSRRESD
eukprot:756823-Hanusia_phi.AAC.1